MWYRFHKYIDFTVKILYDSNMEPIPHFIFKFGVSFIYQHKKGEVFYGLCKNCQ